MVTSLAELLQPITETRLWSLKARIIAGERHSPRLLQLNLDSNTAKDLFPSADSEHVKRVFDSSVEVWICAIFHIIKNRMEAYQRARTTHGWTGSYDP